MAISVMPQSQTLSGVYSVIDFVPELKKSTESTTKALQNAFNFGTKVHDYMKSREQGKLMKKDIEDLQALKQSIKDDQTLLVDLKNELASLERSLEGGE